MVKVLAASPKSSGGLSASALKTIAIVAMLIDHLGWAFVQTESPLGVVMHTIGRITGPTMFYFLVEGYHRTSDINKYMLRMGIFAVISYPAFLYYKYGHFLPTGKEFYPVGVIYTMFLGLLMLRAMNEITSKGIKVIVVIGLMLLSLLGDWPLVGLVFVLFFEIGYGAFKKQFMLCGILVAASVLDVAFSGQWQFMLIQLGQMLPLLLLGQYNGKQGGGGKAGRWFFYAFYPAHLVLVGILQKMLN